MTKTRTAIAAVITAAGLAAAGALHADAATKPAPNYTSALADALIRSRPYLPACREEDGSASYLPCYWDASTEGNGWGQSFIAMIAGPRRNGVTPMLYLYIKDRHFERGTI